MSEQAWMRYDAWTEGDGRIVVDVQTNDNNDDGLSDGMTEEWRLFFSDRARFDKLVGRSRIGCSGIRVTVVLDGQRI